MAEQHRWEAAGPSHKSPDKHGLNPGWKHRWEQTEYSALPRQPWPQRQLPQSWCIGLHAWHLSGPWDTNKRLGPDDLLRGPWNSVWDSEPCTKRQAGTRGRETLNLLALHCTLSPCFLVSLLSTLGHLLLLLLSCFLSYSLFPPYISLPLWIVLHHTLLLPCQVLRWKPHTKHHSEILFFWDAKKLCSTRLAFPPLLRLGGGPPLLERLKSGSKRFTSTWNPGHVWSAGWTEAGVGAEKSGSKKFTISHSHKLCCLWISGKESQILSSQEKLET